MSLKIVSQPGVADAGFEFYKDEGGKGNWMRLCVQAVSGDGLTTAKPTDKPLLADLYFESGLRVEESDQKILVVRPGSAKPRVKGARVSRRSAAAAQAAANAAAKKLLVNPATRKCYIEFRIQKVSRRKDNQRFKVRIRADPSWGEQIEPVFTHPITVLSKRKIPAHIRDNPEAIAKFKAARASQKTSPALRPAATAAQNAQLMNFALGASSMMKDTSSFSSSASSHRRMTGTGRKRMRSEEETPMLRPADSASTSRLSSGGTSKKRARSSSGRQTQATQAMQVKIDQMGRTIDKLYDMMQDQRVQISKLQEQVRALTDLSGLGVLSGFDADGIEVPSTGFAVMSHRCLSPIRHPETKCQADAQRQQQQQANLQDELSLARLTPRKGVMPSPGEHKSVDAPLQWNFAAPALDPLPVLNL